MTTDLTLPWWKRIDGSRIPSWEGSKGKRARDSQKQRDHALAYGNADHQADWRKNNPDKHRANKAHRRAIELQATPKWLTREQKDEMRRLRAEAIIHKMVIDHIIPLQNDNVCGLHVPWNLQIITPDDNLYKGNE